MQQIKHQLCKKINWDIPYRICSKIWPMGVNPRVTFASSSMTLHGLLVTMLGFCAETQCTLSVKVLVFDLRRCMGSNESLPSHIFRKTTICSALEDNGSDERWGEANIYKHYVMLLIFYHSPTSDGAAACVLASENFVRRHNLQGQAVEILAQVLTTDTPSTFEEKSAMKVVGYDMIKTAADRCFREAGWYI